MLRTYPIDAKHLFHQILLASKFYQDDLERLTRENATGEYDSRDYTIAGMFENPALYHHYVEVSRREQVDFSAYHTSLEKIERRWRELDFDARRDALLAQLGPEETQRRLLEEVTILVNAYCSKVNRIRNRLEEMTAKEYEEYQRDDELSDLETLTLRGSADLLLPLLPESEKKSVLQRDMAQADATLRRHGAEMFGPLLRMGSIQQLREARFEPRERWWWYLDELSAE